MPPVEARRHKEMLAYIALGSNLGQRRAMLDTALQHLRAEDDLQVRKVSSFYVTAPIGGPKDQAEYLNGVVEIITTLKAEELLTRLLSIEKKLGRKRQQRWGPRCIDLDLLLYGQDIINSERLVVPHPLMHQREFVLRGLAEIAPDAKHPVLGMTAQQMWQKVLAQNEGP